MEVSNISVPGYSSDRQTSDKAAGRRAGVGLVGSEREKERSRHINPAR